MLTARAAGGTPVPSDETSQVRWVRSEEVDGYQMDPSMRMRVRQVVERRTAPYLG